MSDTEPVGTCSACESHFRYAIIHTGFADAAYAYCDTCGMTASLNGWAADIPPAAELKVHARITESVEPYLAPCECGGRFRATARPRCPRCRDELPAEAVRKFIEANASGIAKGWRWQGTWDGLYCIVIEGRVVKDPWLHRAASRAPEA
jgi:hypothetical protein